MSPVTGSLGGGTWFIAPTPFDPAGELEAFRIEVFGWNKDKSRVGSVNGDLKLTETYWYAPAVKRIIKYQGKQTKWIPPADTEVRSLVYELSAYQLAPPTP